MFTKFFRKADQSPQNVPQRGVTLTDLNPRVSVHYGIPSTASILAFDPIQRLLAIGTLDGRIKVIGGDNIEGLLISPKPLPFKNLQFLQNQGFLASVSNENEIQVWDLEHRLISFSLQWESNITAFSVIYGTHYMYIGDEYGFLSVLKYDADEGKIIHLPYHIPADLVAEGAGISLSNHLSIVGVLPQPCSSGNRVLIAYENGLIILWDVTEDGVVLVRGQKDLQLKDEIVVHPPNDLSHESLIETSDDEQAEKEISSLCWASSDGTILAVGYVDGDILLWDLSDASSAKDKHAQKSSNNDVVKLQLSSGNRRLPVIVLHWSMDRADNDFGGQLFVYGGDEIGSEEVLTILNLDWSSGIETLKCIGRVDLTLSGSFADLTLVPNTCPTESGRSTSLFLLSNPGQLHVYDDACLSALISQPERQCSVPGIQYPMTVPTVEPEITVTKLSSVYANGRFSKGLLETVLKGNLQPENNMTTGTNTMWPLTGGVPNQLSTENDVIERVYVAGYQDGSVRIWDATFPVLSLIFVIGSKVEGIEVPGAGVSVSALDFCSSTLSLAVGNEYGLVRLYRLVGNSDETNFHFVTEGKHEVVTVHYENGAQSVAVFSLLNSPIHTLQFVNSGVELVVGFECGQVAVLKTSSLSVLFLTDSVSSPSSPAISLAVKSFPDTHNDSEALSENRTSNESKRAVFLILTRDVNILVMDTEIGSTISSLSMHRKESTAISIFILEDKLYTCEASGENHTLISSHNHEANNKPTQTNFDNESDSCEVEFDKSYSGQNDSNSLVLLCCEDALHLYSLKTLLQGENNCIHKVNLAKPCCWTTVFKKDEKTCGLIVVYQSGSIEIRSLPDLEVVGECSLMSILRWNFKTNMHKTMSSSNTGQIALVNGCEVALISLLAFENDLRIPESLPCLHDKVLEAAAYDSTSSSQSQKKKEGTVPGMLDGIIKGFQGGKADHFEDLTEYHQTVLAHLESIFSRSPFSDPLTSIVGDPEVLELNIDDLDIDEPLRAVPISYSSLSHTSKNDNRGDNRDKVAEREKLFEGGKTDTKPTLRTAEEIRAKYRKDGDASSAASQARDKLVERQEKLEKLKRNTEELQSGAENFSSMASELAKQMEKRKWWNI